MKRCSWFGGKPKSGWWVLVACGLPVSILCHQAVNIELLFRYMTHGRHQGRNQGLGGLLGCIPLQSKSKNKKKKIL